jgi:hypothetical protein
MSVVIHKSGWWWRWVFGVDAEGAKRTQAGGVRAKGAFALSSWFGSQLLRKWKGEKNQKMQETTNRGHWAR